MHDLSISDNLFLVLSNIYTYFSVIMYENKKFNFILLYNNDITDFFCRILKQDPISN